MAGVAELVAESGNGNCRLQIADFGKLGIGEGWGLRASSGKRASIKRLNLLPWVATEFEIARESMVTMIVGEEIPDHKFKIPKWQTIGSQSPVTSAATIFEGRMQRALECALTAARNECVIGESESGVMPPQSRTWRKFGRGVYAVSLQV